MKNLIHLLLTLVLTCVLYFWFECTELGEMLLCGVAALVITTICRYCPRVIGEIIGEILD